MRRVLGLLLACTAVLVLVLLWPSAPGRTPAGFGEEAPVGKPSRYGVLTSSRWAYGATFRREDLAPVPNPNPHPEPQPHRDHPYDVAVTRDGKKAYVTLLGNEAEPGNEVAVFDVVRRKVLGRIRVGSGPCRAAFHPGGRFLVVLNRFSNYASVIDTVKDEVVSEIPLDFYCADICHDRAGSRAYVSNRYLNQILLLDVSVGSDTYAAEVRPLGGFDEKVFREEVHATLQRSCGAMRCHATAKGGFYAGSDVLRSFFSALENAVPGDPKESLLLRAVLPVEEGGFADDKAGSNFHAASLAVWKRSDPGCRRVADWVESARYGPGIPVGNPGSKPRSLALSSDGRFLYVGNLGTQAISIVDLGRNEEVTGIYTQNVTTGLAVYSDRRNDRDLLIALSLGAGFGAAKERDPYGGESGDPDNEAAQFTLLRDLETTEPLPLDEQTVLGPFDAVDGTAASKMADIQNDILVVDASRLEIPPPSPHGRLRYALLAHRYEAHRAWVRYTSDSAEILPQDFSGDIPPELQRVVGAFPEHLAVAGDKLFVVMAGTQQLVEWRIDPGADEPSEILVPVAVHATGVMPQRVAVGRDGLLFVTNMLSETLRVIDTRSGTFEDHVVGDLSRPFPDSDAERGQVFVQTAVYSVDRDTACVSCHIHDTSDARSWGAGQAIAQMRDGKFVNGGLLGIPQLRNLWAAQPFYFEGTHSAFDAQFDDAREHVALQGFLEPNVHGDFTSISHHGEAKPEHEEIQDKMATTAWGPLYHDLKARRDELVGRLTMRSLGKAFTFRDLQRAIGEYQAAEPRLRPNPYDETHPSVARGRLLFGDLAVGCVVCHTPPHFTNKSETLTHNAERALPQIVTFTEREASFTLVGPHWMDAVNGFERDLEPWDGGRIERRQGMVTTFPLRGLWDRPFVFLHHGRALSIREAIATPNHYSLRRFRYRPLRGGEEVRPGGRERGFNELSFLRERTFMLDTHGGTSHLTARQIQDLENFLLTIE